MQSRTLDKTSQALIERLSRRLTASLPGGEAQSRMAPKALPAQQTPRSDLPKPSAVLLLLYPAAAGLSLLLTERSQAVTHHKGQISLPGGRVEEGDDSLWHTALREAWEETGVNPDSVAMLGALTPLYIAGSHFHVHPFVGTTATTADWQPHPPEVTALLEMPLAHLMAPESKRLDQRPLPEGMRQVPYYDLDGRVIWGATAMILSEFETLLRSMDPKG